MTHSTTPTPEYSGNSTEGQTHGDQLSLFIGGDSRNGSAPEQSDRAIPAPGASAGAPVSDDYRSLPIRLIECRSGGRVADARPALVRSIARVGLLQPLIVERSLGRYRLVAGRARLAAVRALAWGDVQCHILPPLDALLTALVPLTENVVRQPLMGDDRVRMYRDLSDVMGSPREAAVAVGVHRVSYFRSMRGIRRPAEDLREASLPRKAVAVLDRLQRVASALTPTQRSTLVSQLRLLLAVLGTEERLEQKE